MTLQSFGPKIRIPRWESFLCETFGAEKIGTVQAALGPPLMGAPSPFAQDAPLVPTSGGCRGVHS